GLNDLSHLEELNLSKNKILELEGLNNLRNLRKLYLTDNWLTKLGGLDNLDRLEILEIKQNKISKIEGLSNLTQLRKLNLSENKISKLEGLNTLSQLNELIIENNPMTEEEHELSKLVAKKGISVIKDYFRKRNLIKKGLLLELNTKLGLTIKIKDFEIDENEQITKLNLSRKSLGEIPEFLKDLDQLEELILSGNEITDIRGLDGLSQLKSLHLEKNWIVEMGGLETLVNLNELYLSSNQISEIYGLDQLINLKVLDLSNNKIEKIVGLDQLRKLKNLNLDENPLQDEDMDIYKNKPINEIVDFCINRKIEEAKVLSKWGEKIKKIIDTGEPIDFKTLQDTLGIDEDSFLNNIWDWAVEYGFTIKRDTLIVNKETVNDFIKMLDTQFDGWEDKERIKEGKI
ncbi:MAG: leucine-rich repeat domain-containing protein, partial [Candidatus Helarchaeota archaeon]